MYTVILAAMIMQSGAKISDDNMQHLREIVPRIHSSPGYAWPLNDEGFRDPGRAQFLAAVEHYKPGTPRTFCEPRSVPDSPVGMLAKMGQNHGILTPLTSCYHCGKIKADLGKKLSMCARCKEASYCGQVGCPRLHLRSPGRKENLMQGT